ncbi:unnamed protein product [Penicillium salamii]|nr:unnamed protein product [Penicillium salamii]CAG8281196.1 unnamed protein product [Penicillium salamii]
MSSANGLRHLIRRFLDRKINVDELARIVGPANTTTLAVTALSPKDVPKMFGLTKVLDAEFDSVVPVPLPEDLKIWLVWVDHAHGASPDDEASVRLKLNLLLVRAHNLVSSSQDKSARPLNIQMERTWAFRPVEWKGKTYTLSGRPDYGIWYGKEEDIDLNVIIMEAKRPTNSSQGIPQALAYMACVHRCRKDIGKADTTVYGIATDAAIFTFMKLDNESRWSIKHVDVVGNGFEQVFGIIIHLMQKAASVSPAASKRTSRRTQQGSGDSDLIFDHNPRRDAELDDELDAE